MRKRFISWLLFTMMAVTAFAGKEELYVLYEGFENGIPAAWSQINEAGQQAWITESATDAEYPAGVVEGDYRVAFRNTTAQTQHFVTKLVTPAFDISQTVHPILMFSRAQVQNTGDVDELRIYYRASADSRWVLLKEYTNKQTKWTQEIIDLPGATATYQLAFEGTDNLGRGVVLDEIIVRPAPTCEDPHGISIDGLTANSVTLRWIGSLDTENFRVVLSTKQITDITQPEGVIYDQLVGDFSVAIDGLSRNTKYYVYIQAQCGVEESEWVTYSFTTKNLANIPFEETFNKEYASGTVSHPSYWTCGTSIKKDDGSMEFMPFINQNTSTSSLKNYSFNSTSCLVFSGARNTSTDIPAGEYVYAATPELNVESVKNLQVSFWGTVYDDFGDEYAGGLVVGVMTDPSDWSTFVAVDTVYAKEQRGFDRYTVYFNNYAGEGKYIAFASNFVDKENLFFMDEVKITAKSEIADITDVTVSNRTALSFMLNAELNGNNAFRVVLARDSVNAKTGSICLEPDSLPADYIVFDKVYQGEKLPLQIKLDSALAGNRWQLYVQPVSGDKRGAMSLPIVLMMPMIWDGVEPLFTGFEEDEACGTWAAKQTTNFGYVSATIVYPFTIMTTPQNLGSTVPAWPSCLGTTYGYNSKKSVFLGKEQQEWAENDIKYHQKYGDYVALPQVEDLSNLMLEFYLRGYSDSYTDISRVAVGVMTDPFDPSTFEPVAYCESPKAKTWVPCIVTFSNYKGEGKFPAIMADVAKVKYKYSTTSGSGGSYTTYKLSYQYVDNITMKPLGGCILPTDLSAQPADTTAVISWTAGGMTKFNIVLSSKEDMSDTVQSILVQDTNKYEVKQLLPHTKYYYTVSTLCEDDAVTSIVDEFKTLCAVNGEPIPYVEDFESYAGGSSTQDLPACWNITLQKYTYSGSGESSTSWYPYIYTVASTAHAGNKCLYFYYTTSGATPLFTGQPTYVTLPMMSEELNKLQFSFWMKAGGTAYVNDTVYVGVMSDPNNITTFDTLQMIKTTANYSEYIIRLDKYAGKGKYIALMKTPREVGRSVYIDDVKVDYLANCEKVQGVTATDFDEDGAVISWNKGDATQWEIVVATKELTADEIAAQDAAIVKDSITAMNPFKVDYCPETNTDYFVYVRALCGETNKGDWSNAISFKTTCVSKTAGGYGFIDFAEDDFKTAEFPCWTVGRREGTTAVPSITVGSHLYMFNTTASEGAYAIMPPIDVDDISKLQVKFTAAGGTGAAYLRELTVGIISNPSDLSTFEAIETVKLPLVATTVSKANHAKNLDEAQTYIVRFDKYAGDYEGNYGKQIMFLSENGGVANYVYIYSMQVDTIPTCLEPLNIEDVEVNTYDATVGWDTIANNYEVQLLADDKTTVLLDSVTDKQQMKFEGLQMLTKYYVQVRTICAVGDTSAWSPMGNFTTQCPVAYELPYEENFDSYTAKTSVPRVQPNCWTTWYDGLDAVTASTAYCYIYASAKNTGVNGFYMGSTTGNAAGTTPAKQSLVTLPAINGLNAALLHFYAKASTTTGTRALKIGVAEYAEPYDSILSSVTWLDSVEDIGKDWTYYTFDLSTYTGAGKHIVIMCYGGNTSATSLSTTALYTYIDDIYVEKMPSCFRPIDLAFASATASSVTLTWTPQGKETAWDIACLPAGEEDITKATITTVSGEGPKGTVVGLTDATDYDFYVRANCGEGDFSEWSSVATATTLCVIPLAEANWNFDDYKTRVLNPNAGNNTSYPIEQCWLAKSTSTTASSQPYLNKNSYSTSNSDVEYVSSKYACTDTFALKFYSTSTAPAIAVMPELVGGNLDEMQVSFVGRSVYESYNTAKDHAGEWKNYYYTYATGTYVHSIKVGTVTDPYDMSTFEELLDYQFTEVTSANCSTKVEGDYWEPVTVSLYGAAGKYIAFLSDYNATNYAWIDNVKVEPETGLNMPTKLKVDEDKLTGYVIPVTWTSRAGKFQVILYDDKDVVLTADTVTASAYTFTGLTPTATYKIEVRAMSEDETQMSAPAKLTVTTPCVPYTKEEAKWDFKNPTNAYTGSTSYLLPTCWDGGLLVGTLATYNPQAKLNTTTYQYAREASVEDRALQFYNGTTTGSGYVIMPELDVNYDSTALHFWMRAAYFYQMTYSSNKGRLYTANNNYAKDLIVGAVKDESDISTFVGLDTITYPYSWSATTNIYTYNDETGNDYWIEVVLPLKKYKDMGKLVMYYPTNSKTGYMYVDDVEVIDADFCTMPTSLRAQSVTSNSANIGWSIVGKDSVQVQIATDESFEEKFIVADSVLVNAEGLYVVKGLDAGTTYIARAKHFCGEEEESDWAVSPYFTTNYKVRFNEQFNAVRTYPVDWTRCNSKIVDVLDNGVTPAPITSETAVNWTRQPNEGDMAASTGTGTGTSTSATYYNYWLLTPTISLKDVDEAAKLMLSFDLYLTDNSNAQPFNKPSEFDQFVVAISTDGGITFPRANATIWNAEGTQRSYGAITGEPTTQMIDLTQYMGQNIVIAFASDAHTELDKPCSKNNIHLDNVQVNTYTEKKYAESICQYNDYEDDDFFIDADNLVVGETTVYSKYAPAAKDGDDDLYTELSLTVNAAVTIENAYTACEGDKIEAFNFVIDNVKKSDVYKQKLESASGCDSISVLNVTVLPTLTEKVEKTICQGDFYEFNGVKYYTSIVKTDSLKSVVTGCDSIVTLYLTVNAILEGLEEENLCQGDSVFFGKYGWITEEGTYEDTVKTAIGCDSAAVLVVYMHQPTATRIQGAILAGESYSDDVFQGLTQAGDYPSMQKTVYGCDSIVTLHLMVANGEMLYDTISLEQLPYIVNGVQLLDESTVAGVYVRQIEHGTTPIDITIIVGDVTALDPAYFNGKCQKMIYNDRMYILNNGKWIDAAGMKVKAKF